MSHLGPELLGSAGGSTRTDGQIVRCGIVDGQIFDEIRLATAPARDSTLNNRRGASGSAVFEKLSACDGEFRRPVRRFGISSNSFALRSIYATPNRSY
jgi:hypothetical protein